MWNYSEQDNQWQLTTADGKTLNVTGWDVTDANAAVIEGTRKTVSTGSTTAGAI